MTLPAGYFYKEGFYWKNDESGPYVYDGATMALVGTGAGNALTWQALGAGATFPGVAGTAYDCSASRVIELPTGEDADATIVATWASGTVEFTPASGASVVPAGTHIIDGTQGQVMIATRDSVTDQWRITGSNSTGPRFLGTFTWSGLQTSYPNGGGALAGLSAGTTACVTDIGKSVIMVTPNAAKTRWIPQNGRATIYAASGDFGAPINSWAGTTGKFSPSGGDITIPASVLGAGDKIVSNGYLKKVGANATAVYNVRIGTTGTYNTDSQISNDTIAITDNRQKWEYGIGTFADATSMGVTNWNIQGQQNTAPGADRATNIDTAAAMYVIIEVTSIHASDTVQLIFWELEWRAAS